MHQAARVVETRSGGKNHALKRASPDFTAMRRLAMRFRGILRSKDIQKFNVWLNDAQQSGIYAMHRFARTLRRDLDAVTNALTEGWSNGQTEGQINRLKTLKRAMYGRAGTELLRARMLPCAYSIPWRHEAIEERCEFVIGVEREYVSDILVGPDNDDAALIPVDAPQVEDVLAQHGRGRTSFRSRAARSVPCSAGARRA